MTYSDIALLVKQAAIEEGVDDVLEEWAAEADPEELAEFLEAAAEELLEEESPLLAKSAALDKWAGEKPPLSDRVLDWMKQHKWGRRGIVGGIGAGLIGGPVLAHLLTKRKYKRGR